jgi:hypothetical protein
MDTSGSVLERNKHPSRDGFFAEPALTSLNAARMKRDPTFNATFTGNMYAAPLYLENGPGGKGVFFAVTTSNDVYALDETTGALVWHTNIGVSPTATGVTCGNIHPLGIVSTPVIDAMAGTIYVAGAIGTTSIARHELHALSVIDGSERSGFPVVMGGTSGATTFAAIPENQRSALSLVDGVVYVAFGGHAGDCGPYHGWVFGIDTHDSTRMGGWATLGQGEGIWASGGMASDGVGVFAVTGNNTAGAGDHMSSDSEEIVRITGLGAFSRTSDDMYFPASWHSMDAADSDLGSSSPMVVTVPGATPERVLVVVGKNGHLYVLDPAHLGGMGGELADVTVVNSNSAVRGAPASYVTSLGTHVVFSSQTAALCPGGQATGPAIMSVVLAPGSPPKPAVEWCAPLGTRLTSPIATTPDGGSSAVVWYMTDGGLTAVDGDTGVPLYTGATTDCSGVRQWTSPIAVKGRIVTGADTHLCAWSPQ